MKNGYLCGSLQVKEGVNLRYFHRQGESERWFCASDVVAALGQPVHSTSTTCAKLPEDQKSRFLVGPTPHLGISAVGMAEIIMRSRAPQADFMRSWVRWWLAQKMETFR